MAVTAEESYKGRRGDIASREIDYEVVDSDGDLDDSEAIDAAAAASPSSVDGLARTNAVISEHKSNGRMKVTVQYGEVGFSGVATQPAGTVEYEFSYQAESEHVYFSYGTRSYKAAGDVGPEDFKGAIMCRKENRNQPDGLDTPAGNTTNVWTYTQITTSLPVGYEQLVEGLMGTVNSVAFKGRPAGSMRFVSCQSALTGGNKLVTRFGFQFRPNLTNVVVAKLTTGLGGITISRWDGHELAWGYMDDGLGPLVGIHTMFPRWIYVEQVFRFGNHNLLGI